MEEPSDHIQRALEREEIRAERIASNVRLIVLLLFAFIELLNVGALSLEASMMNGVILLVGCIYGFIVALRLRRGAYHPIMKYVTSYLDVTLVFLLLFMYTRIEIPSVALKNYVFLITFVMIALTAFRYDRMLTLSAGGLAVAQYCVLILYLYLTHSITISQGGYEQELFTSNVTVIGQTTKILILVGFVVIMSYLAEYSRKLFFKLVHEEANLRFQKNLTDIELKVASDVQARLLPSELPLIDRFDTYVRVQQGRLVGGDYCDILKHTDHDMFLVAADVSGKGVPAALIMAEMRTAVHLLAPAEMTLTSVVEQINGLLYRSTAKKDFVTCFIAAIDSRHNVLTYVNAGHPPPLLYSEGTITSLSTRTIPLGLYPALPQLATSQVQFGPGSLLVSFTDGLLEQTNDQGDQFGEERVREFIMGHASLKAEPLAEELLSNLRTFGQGKPFNDDVGLAVVRFLP